MNSQSMIQSATDDGMSAHAVGILVNNLTPMTLAGAQGVSLADLATDSVTIYVRVIDQSSSMSPYQKDVIAAANEQLQALAKSKDADSILMSTFVFNHDVTLLHSYLALPDVLVLDTSSYSPNGSTALYQATLDAITSAVGYAQTLRNGGVTVKVVIVIITDGEDNASKHTPANVKTVITDLLQQEIYTVAFVAFGTQGKSIAAAMGIPQNNVLDVNASAHDIRLAFNTMSQSVINTSQNLVGASGGFFTP